jgi:hypothetical protein
MPKSKKPTRKAAPKRKAREWEIAVDDFNLIRLDKPSLLVAIGQDPVIRVREILPRTPAKKRGKR